MKPFQKSLVSICASALCIYPALLAEQKARITLHNDDSLHGIFSGINEKNKVIWNNESSAEPIHFDIFKISSIVIKNNLYSPPSKSISSISLINNGVIEGQVLALSDNTLEINSSNLGKINIPKKYIREINYKPNNKNIHYQGPKTNKEEWKLLYSSPKIAKQYKDAKPPWKQNDFNITHDSMAGAFLTKVSYPDKFTVTFNLKNTKPYAPAIILMADLNIPKEIKQPENQFNRMTGRINHAKYLGNSLIIELNANVAKLSYYGFNDDNSIAYRSFDNKIPRGNNRLSTISKHYEIKVDKTNGTILLFVNDKISARWNVDFNAIKANGPYLGFKKAQYSRSSKTTKAFISEIQISTWDGILHTATPISNSNRDVLLMKNGVDRISGEIISITSDNIELKNTNTKLGLFTIPINQIKQIIFSNKIEAPTSKSTNDNIVINTVGPDRYTAQTLKSKNKKLVIKSKIFGDANLDINNITSIKFPPTEKE